MKNGVALITGASSGIGAALAREFHGRGYRVVLLARRTERIEALARELSADGSSALALRCDVTQDDDLEEAVRLTVERYSRIDVVIANAGFGVAGKFEKLGIDDYRRQFETNVFGVLRTVRAALPELKKTKGSIAIVGSVAGYIALPGGSAYSMSKSAVRALSEALWYELGQEGISVTHIAPGYIKTEITQVDNQGVFRADQAPSATRLHMPADQAARQMASAIVGRKREAVITLHGKLSTSFQRHFPGAFMALLSRLDFKKRQEPGAS